MAATTPAGSKRRMDNRTLEPTKWSPSGTSLFSQAGIRP